MTGIVIPFDAARRRQAIKTDATAAKRIAEKEATYRGLIEQEARFRGETLEEALPAHTRMDERIDTKRSAFYQSRAARLGISVYEAQLDVRIERMSFLVNDILPNLSANVEYRLTRD